jgi:hypothetical protein
MPPHQTLATPGLPMAEPAEEGRLKKGNSYTLQLKGYLAGTAKFSTGYDGIFTQEHNNPYSVTQGLLTQEHNNPYSVTQYCAPE